MRSPGRAIGRSQVRIQPSIWPIWLPWVEAMSVARMRICWSSVESITSSDISTAWAWCSIMSRAKPAETLSSPGAGRAKTSHPRSVPTSSARIAVPAMTAMVRLDRSVASLVRGPVTSASVATWSVAMWLSAGSRVVSAGVSGRVSSAISATHQVGAGAAGAGGAGLGSLWTLPPVSDELLDPCVVALLHPKLTPPGRRHDGVLLTLVRREDDELLGGQVAQLLHLALGEVRLVREPDGAVLQRVDRVVVGNRLLIDAAVEPGRVVITAGRGTLLVLDRGLDVVAAEVVGGVIELVKGHDGTH